MNDFRSLREYQEHLRYMMDAARSSSIFEKIIYFGFTSGGKNYLIDGRDVIGVHQRTLLEPIPLAKPWAVGAANIKGSVYAITDFSLLIGGEATNKGKFLIISPKIIAGSALIIDSITGLYDIDDLGDFTPTDSRQNEWIVGSYDRGSVFNLVDVNLLAKDEKFNKLQYEFLQ